MAVKLTDKHRVEYRNVYGDGTHETSICKGMYGSWFTESTGSYVLPEGTDELDPRVVRVISPPLEHKVGTILRGESASESAVFLPDKTWQVNKGLQNRLNLDSFEGITAFDQHYEAGEVTIWWQP